MTTLLDVQGRRTVGYLVNKSGGAVVKGDTVIVDASNDEAFTTSTAGAEVVAIGVVTEENGIASNASGRVTFAGYVDLITVNAAVTRGHFGKTHTVAKQTVDAGASRVLGVFCEFLKSGATPSAWLFGLPDGVTGAGGLSGGTPGLTFGTSNAAGAAASGIRTDATLAIFDATVPGAIGTAAAGSAGVAARRDHVHPITTVDQDISADFTSANDSAWHDITGLTGISVAAGTWIAIVDLEHDCTTNYGPVFRVNDGTNDYAQAGGIWIYLATVSHHTSFTSKPFTLGSTATMKVQVLTDTTLKILKYPIRGGLSTQVASHITFLRIA